jgi:hypothetical protein
MAQPASPRHTKILLYSLFGIGFLVLVTVCCTFAIVLGIDVFLTKSYFAIARINWLRLFGLAFAIVGIVALARSLYARFSGS